MPYWLVLLTEHKVLRCYYATNAVYSRDYIDVLYNLWSTAAWLRDNCTGRLKRRERKTRHQSAGVEKARKLYVCYAQALVKRTRKLGLTDACNSDVETSTAIIFRCLLCLPLLPVGDVQTAFAKVSALLNNDSPSKPAMSQLLRYVSRQWLQKSSTGPAGLSV